MFCLVCHGAPEYREGVKLPESGQRRDPGMGKGLEGLHEEQLGALGLFTGGD